MLLHKPWAVALRTKEYNGLPRMMKENMRVAFEWTLEE